MKQPGHMFPLLLATLCLAIPANLDAADPPARVPWTTSRVTGTPEGPSPYLTERAFPKLAFKTPVELVRIPGSKRLLVAELSGKLLSFPDDQSVSSTDLVLDLKKHLPKLSHLYGVTFHPKFETNRTCFISYVFGGAPDGSKVSRFKMTDADPPTIDPGSEQVLITWPSGGHNGAAIRFGPDGYLYISTGDGVGPNPPDPKNNGQDCSNLFSSILRIDVDRHDPGRAYRIPPENPLVGIEGLRTEIWAYGFRNPWKISFDPRRGDLWVGDVGWELWEMVYRVVKGGNYGWSIVEGPQPVNTHLTRGPTPILPPTVAHPHSEAASITGGIVYYGSKLPDLSGEYVYGDYETGKLWALKWDGKQVSRLREISDTALRIICFGADTSNELLFMGHTAGTIHRLVDNPDRDQPGRFPKRLSETGLFSSVTDHRYASGVVAYRVAAEPWADGAITRRAVALPGASTIRTKGQWSFPTGSVLLKTISLELTPGDAASRRRIETQLLHFDGQGWRGYGYRWNDNQSDAELVDAAGVDVPFEVRDSSAGGGQRRQTHHFAARVECVRCHNKWSGDALAFNTAGLDVPDARDPAAANQLDQLSGLGLFDPPLKAGAKPPLVDPYNSDHSLEARSRSWLQVNCAHCHRMHAGSSVLAYMHHDLPLAKTLLIDTKPSQGTFGIPEARIVAPGDRLRSVLYLRVSKLGRGRMPHIGSERVDHRGVALIGDWIAGLAGGDRPIASYSEAERRTRIQAVGNVRQLEQSKGKLPQELLTRILASTASALRLQSRLDAAGTGFSDSSRREIVRKAMAHDDITVRDLFERFIPEEQRTRRLGRVIRPETLLALPGDVERGRRFFLETKGVQCRNCHRIGGQGKQLGPDLDGIGKKYGTREILDQILNPSRKIDKKYLTYLVETTAGRVHTGLLARRSDKEIVLRNAKGEEVRIPGNEVETVIAQRKSLMPDLLLKDMTANQVADLLAFLSTLKAGEK